MSTFFISDLHLSHQTPNVFDGFCHFLNTTAANAERLYILGDFFDAWIGDDEDDALVSDIKHQLRQFSAKHPVFFMAGNRDFLIGEQFAKDTGISLLPEQIVIDLYGRKTLLLHGDTLCTSDTDYLRFRAMVRSSQWQQQVLSLPLQQRRLMAADLRQKSQSMNAMKAEDIMDVTPAEVLRVMSAQDVDLLIHGHTHRPAIHNILLNERPAQRCVLGDWHQMGWYIEASENHPLQLTQFAI
jgi:UDP-2,3-diacylglucosamine hydrolase